MANDKCACGHWRSQHESLLFHRGRCRYMETDPFKNPKALECLCVGFIWAETGKQERDNEKG